MLKPEMQPAGPQPTPSAAVDAIARRERRPGAFQGLFFCCGPLMLTFKALVPVMAHLFRQDLLKKLLVLKHRLEFRAIGFIFQPLLKSFRTQALGLQ